MRPQFGSPPCQLVLTSGLFATACGRCHGLLIALSASIKMVGMIGMPVKVMEHKAATPKAAFGARMEILTAEEVSLRLRLPLSTVYYLAKTGVLPGFQLGRSWRFSSSELDCLMQSKPAKPRILAADTGKESPCGGKYCPAKSGTGGNKCLTEESLQSLEPIANANG